MTFDPTTGAPNEDAWAREVANLLADGPTPDHAPNFWDRIDAELPSAPVLLADHRGNAISGVALADGALDDTVVSLGAPSDDANDESRRGVRWLLAAAAAFLAILGISGYLLNGATGDESIVFAGDGTGDGGIDDESSRPSSAQSGSRVVISPLIDFSAARVRDANTVMFTIESSMPLRTRMAVLSGFIDSVWTSENDYRPVADGTFLDRDFVDPRMMTTSFRGTATIDVPDSSPLSPWLPLPFEASTVTVLEGGAPSFESQDVQLISSREEPTQRYEVTYSSPITTTGAAGLPSVAAPADLQTSLAPYLELFDATRAKLAAEASALLAGNEPPVERAAKLLDYFSSMTVIADAPRGHSITAVMQSIELNQGSPEVIASGLAAMARAVGIPSRVVVGFGPGELAGGSEDMWVVRGQDRTVWVELNIDGLWEMYDPAPVGSVAQNQGTIPPRANRDHWHAIYAIYDCATDSYLSPLLSESDEFGIHSHQDGIIWIHPWSESSAGENATLDVFFETMGVEVRPDRIVAADDGVEVVATDECPDGSIVHLRKWRFDFEYPNTKPEVVTANIGDVQFRNDREVYILAVAPLDAELPPLPEFLFRELDGLSAPLDGNVPGPTRYVVRAGDTWEDVATQLDTNLAGLGDMASTDEPVPGQVFETSKTITFDQIPLVDASADVARAVAEEVGTWFYHVAEEGDTFESLAEQFNIDIELLRDVNPIFDGPLAGEQVVIPQFE